MPALPTTHVVKEGEFLSSIAQLYYGDGSIAKTDKIYEAYKGVITDKNIVIPGMKLTIRA